MVQSKVSTLQAPFAMPNLKSIFSKTKTALALTKRKKLTSVNSRLHLTLKMGSLTTKTSP